MVFDCLVRPHRNQKGLKNLLGCDEVRWRRGLFGAGFLLVLLPQLGGPFPHTALRGPWMKDATLP